MEQFAAHVCKLVDNENSDVREAALVTIRQWLMTRTVGAEMHQKLSKDNATLTRLGRCVVECASFYLQILTLQIIQLMLRTAAPKPQIMDDLLDRICDGFQIDPNV